MWMDVWFLGFTMMGGRVGLLLEYLPTSLVLCFDG